MTSQVRTDQPGLDELHEDLLDKVTRGARLILEGAHAETGQTPKEVIWSRNKARLYRYRSETERQHRVPILFVYALLNRPYCLDLMPGNSFVEFLVDEGFDVYLLDWGIAGPEDRDQTFDDLIVDYLPRAVRKVLRCAGTDEFTLFGYCMGGSMSLMYASLFPEGIKNLILLATPVDCSPEHTGLYGQWFAERNHDPRVIVNAYGNLPPQFAYTGTALLNPVTNYIGKYVNMWEMILRDKPMTGWLAMSKWADEAIPMPGGVYKQWVEDFYQHNRLAKGELRLRGRRVDLSTISAPLLNIAGSKDHLVFLPQAEAAMDLVGSVDKEFVELEAGHVGLLTGRGAKKGLWPKVRDWLEPRST
jgi:polyhydroxyalkanoate synthase